jgi:hypothetical protein
MDDSIDKMTAFLSFGKKTTGSHKAKKWQKSILYQN